MQSELSIAIPTYRRGQRLCRTIEAILALRTRPLELLLIDQTEVHPEEVCVKLQMLAQNPAVRWIRLDQPSIPRAMNVALRETTSGVLLFLDDDIVPKEGLIDGHLANYSDTSIWAVAGRVIESGTGRSPSSKPRSPGTINGVRLASDLDFDFASAAKAVVRNCKAGNLSVRVDRALQAGGFDETFEGSAFRFETEFCRRLIGCGGKVVFDPTPEIEHLHETSGGTREFGKNVNLTDPRHFVGDYYFAFRCGRGIEIYSYLLKRFRSTSLNRYTVRRPWTVVSKAIAHVKAFKRAKKLVQAPPRLMRGDCRTTEHSVR